MPDADDPKVFGVVHAKFKIEWAKNHINGVEQIVKSITSQTGHVIKPYQDTQTGIYVLYIGPKEGIPVPLPLHMGDAVHNLNSVMDYLWSGLARTLNPELASKITFPRHETRENLVNSLSDARGYNAKIKQAFPKAEEFVLDMVKPYKGDDDNIWSLNKLDNANKHRLLIPTTNIIEFKRDLIARSKDGGTFVHKGGVRMHTQGPNLSVGFATPFEVNDDAEPIIDVVFERGDPCAGKPVLETLVNLTGAVSEVVRAFEETFLTS